MAVDIDVEAAAVARSAVVLGAATVVVTVAAAMLVDGATGALGADDGVVVELVGVDVLDEATVGALDVALVELSDPHADSARTPVASGMNKYADFMMSFPAGD